MEISEHSVSLNPLKTAFTRQKESFIALRQEGVKQRKARLKALRAWIHLNRQALHQALFDDFRKPAAEVDAIEIFHVLSELRFALKHVSKWARPRRVQASLALAGTHSRVLCEPKGVCLILSPWNYPFALSAGPLVSALAAGNAVILKPSEHTPHVSALLRRMVHEVFEPHVVTIFEGGEDVARQLLTLPFDHIFFTGSPAIGKHVMRAAADHLASVTLELGGKSPAIVTHTARIKEAAQRIAVAKFVNAGQTCVAPDYVLVDASVSDAFITALVDEITARFAAGGSFEASDSYCRMVNTRHFGRVREWIDEAVAAGASVVLGGPSDELSRFIHPVVLKHVPPGTRLLEEEIFGPVLPVIAYNRLDEALHFIQQRPNPLALYVFTQQHDVAEQILRQTSSGGACVNECAIHFLHHGLPFGGAGASGIGKAHGHYGFLAFSNEKPVLYQRNGFTSIGMFYPPYTGGTARLMEWFLKLF
jgi:aldehyde dehydrogenase (NAD+)